MSVQTLLALIIPVPINQLTQRRLDESQSARNLLTKVPVRARRNEQYVEPGDFFANYAGALLNRQIDVFDDAMLLVGNDRVGSACVVSRGMIEAYALAQFAVEEVTRAFENAPSGSKVEKALDITLKFTNSSRFKKSEQEKLKNGVFKLEDYKFTEEAKERMLAELGNNVHVLNALRYLYAREKEETQLNESKHELVYDALSEWVHPSQTSVWLTYATSAQAIETSLGTITLRDAAMNYCSLALHFITASNQIFQHMLEVANVINAASRSEELR